MKTEQQDNICIKDIWLASVLLSKKNKLQHYARNNGTVFFYFDNPNDKAKKISEAYIKGESVLVDARALVEANRQLKEIIFS